MENTIIILDPIIIYFFRFYQLKELLFHMHVFNVAVYASFAYYALFVERSLILAFLAVIAIYFLLSFAIKGKSLSTRRKLMLATWSDPSEGVIINRVPVRT